MFKNYVKTTYRYMMKNKAITFLNIFALALGTGAFLLILNYVMYERSYDTFHDRSDRTYRVALKWFKAGQPDGDIAANFYGAGPALKREIPEVEESARLRPWFGGTVVSHGQTHHKMDKIFFADPEVFDVFSFPMIKGNGHTALANPGSILISESVSNLLFGKEEAIGKTISLKQGTDNREFEVDGVFKDIPSNSHIHFNLLLPYKNLGDFGETNWTFSEVYTYVVFNEGTDFDQLQAKFPDMIKKFNGEDLADGDFSNDFLLQPIADIHLHSHLDNEVEVNGDSSIIYSLMMIGLIILAVVYINYQNLTSANVINRAKEVAVKKIFGSVKRHIIFQVFTDAFIINLLAIVIGLIMVDIFTGYSQAYNARINQANIWEQTWIWPTLLALSLVGPVLTSLYPAILTASLNPSTSLKGRFKHSNMGIRLRKGLTFFQFSASVILIAYTLTVFQQTDFMRSQKLGVNIDEILVVRAPIVRDESFAQKVRFFKEEILEGAAVKSVALSSEIPGNKIGWNNTSIRKQNASDEEINESQILGVDYDFIKTYELELMDGREFDKRVSTDIKSLIINEAAVPSLGFNTPEEALNYPIKWENREDGNGFKIVGVVKNYHQTSLKESIEPTIFTLEPDAGEYVSVKLLSNQGNLEQAIAQIRESYDSFFPSNSFDYFFLDNHFNEQYLVEQDYSRALSLFTFIAIVVSSLGLFALILLSFNQRARILSIHRVMGASIKDTIALLSLNTLKLVAFSILVSIPIAYLVVRDWLNGYAFRVELGWWFFLLPSLGIIFVVFIAMSYHIIKVTNLNPIKNLRDDG